MSPRRTALRTACANRPNVAPAPRRPSTATTRSASSSSTSSSDSGAPERRGARDLVLERPLPQRADAVLRRRLRGGHRLRAGAPAPPAQASSPTVRRPRSRASGPEGSATSPRAGCRRAQRGAPHQLDHEREPLGQLGDLLSVRIRASSLRIALQITPCSASTACDADVDTAGTGERARPRRPAARARRPARSGAGRRRRRAPGRPRRTRADRRETDRRRGSRARRRAAPARAAPAASPWRDPRPATSSASIGASATGRARRRRGGPAASPIFYHAVRSSLSVLQAPVHNVRVMAAAADLDPRRARPRP